MNETTPISFNPEAMWVLPWNPDGAKDDERVASTLDIRDQLKLVKPGSFDEYSLCFEAALDKDRPLPDRERYLLSRYGHEYAIDPDKFNRKLNDIEARMAENVGEFVLLQKSPTFVFIDRLSSPHLSYVADIRGGHPYMGISIETSSSISTIVDDNFKVVPELTRDFVNVRTGNRLIAEGSTQVNWIQDGPRGEWRLDPINSCYHEGDEYGVYFGMDEIRKWQRDNLQWAQHVDNMMEAWNTGLISYPVARQKRLDSALDYISVYQIAEHEVKEVRALIPPKGLPGDERREYNLRVMEKLTITSDTALVWLTQGGHDLSRRELVKRMTEGRIRQIQSLLEIMMPVYRQRIDVYNDKLFAKAYDLALRLASFAQRRAMVDLVERFMEYGVFRDREFFINILSQRQDIEEIMKTVEKSNITNTQRAQTLKDEALAKKQTPQTRQEN